MRATEVISPGRKDDCEGRDNRRGSGANQSRAMGASAIHIWTFVGERPSSRDEYKAFAFPPEKTSTFLSSTLHSDLKQSFFRPCSDASATDTRRRTTKGTGGTYTNSGEY